MRNIGFDPAGTAIKTLTSNSEAPFENMLWTADDVAGEVIELKNWQILFVRAAQVIAAFATDKQTNQSALSMVQDVASRYKFDVVVSRYVRLFESDRAEDRFSYRESCN